jgi:hypothetical protein
MNYKDLQNIAFLSQEILTESATKEHNALDRWPYTSPYLQESTEVSEERAPGVKPYGGGKEVGDKMRAGYGIKIKAQPLSGKTGDASGYGAPEKFKKPDDNIEMPGTTVPAPKKGGYGRISRTIPYGIGDHATPTQSRVSVIVRKDPGAPTSQKLPPEGKKKLSREIIRRKPRVDEDFELWVDELIDEGYDLSGYTWDELYEGYKKLPIGKMIKQAVRKQTYSRNPYDTDYENKEVNKMARIADRHSIIKGKGKVRGEGQAELNRRRGEMKEEYDLYDLILSHLLDEGYAETVENAEAIMVNMSEDWRDSILG